MRERFKHLRHIAHWWWFLIAGIWSVFWIVDGCIQKWGAGSDIQKWWDAHTQHLPTNWKAWLIGMLVIGVLLIIEGSYRHSRTIAMAASTEAASLRTMVDTLKEEVRIEKERSLPKLSGEILQSVKGDAIGDHDKKRVVQVYMQAAVRNLGIPSIAHSFQLEIERGDYLKISGTTTLIHDGFTLFGGEDNHVIAKFKQGDALYEKTATAIGTGDQRIGWLRFDFEGLTAAEITGPDVRYMLHFRDVTGREIWAIFQTTADTTKEQLVYHPGSTQPFTGLKPEDRSKSKQQP